jgi:hypothetical protein
VITPQQGDVIVVEVTGTVNTRTYRIDTNRWVIVELAIDRYPVYNATFEWGFDGEIHYLTAVYLQGDETLQAGGLSFSSIRLNGQSALGVADRARPRRGDAPYRIVDSRGDLGQAWSSPFVVVRDLRGRRIGVRAARRGRTGIHLSRLPAGTYLLQSREAVRRHTTR